MGTAEGRIENEKQLQELQKDGFYLSNYYFLFQGVIFTAFYNGGSSPLKCHFRWLPFTLSILAGALNLSALLVIAFRYKNVLNQKDEDLITRLESSTDSTSSVRTPFVIRYEKTRRLVILVGCMALFIGFFVITLYGSLKIPCQGIEEPYGTETYNNNNNNNNNCVNLCDTNNCITICQSR